MKYIITESQLRTWLKRRLTPEKYFDYVKYACKWYDNKGVDLEQYIQDIHTSAIDEFLLREFSAEHYGEEEIYEAFEDCLTDCFNGEIYDYIMNFYYDNDIERPEDDEDDENLSFDDL